MISKLKIKQATPMNEVYGKIINKVNELVDIVNQLQYNTINTINPIEVMWNLLQMPEEERIRTAHLWDYCEEEVDKNGKIKTNS